MISKLSTEVLRVRVSRQMHVGDLITANKIHIFASYILQFHFQIFTVQITLQGPFKSATAF